MLSTILNLVDRGQGQNMPLSFTSRLRKEMLKRLTASEPVMVGSLTVGYALARQRQREQEMEWRGQ